MRAEASGGGVRAEASGGGMQAGARKVYAVEASNMVKFAQKLFDGNGADGARIEILHGKAETLLESLPERADVLISEPMGTLLVNERMLETYIFARKHMLKPGGLMFPNLGRIFTAPFSDTILFDELRNLAAFWTNPSFYGVNLTALHADAYEVRGVRPPCAAPSAHITTRMPLRDLHVVFITRSLHRAAAGRVP